MAGYHELRRYFRHSGADNNRASYGHYARDMARQAAAVTSSPICFSVRVESTLMCRAIDDIRRASSRYAAYYAMMTMAARIHARALGTRRFKFQLARRREY